MNGKSGNGAGRKPGDWKNVANGRANIRRDVINGHGVSNVPSPGDIGSAAYRRLQARNKRGK